MNTRELTQLGALPKWVIFEPWHGSPDKSIHANRIKNGEYKQIFTPLREGRGVASLRMVS